MYCLISNINTSKNKIILSLVTNTNTSGDPTCSSDCQRASEPLVAHILCLRTFTFFIAEAQGRMQRKQNVKNGLLPNTPLGPRPPENGNKILDVFVDHFKAILGLFDTF